MAKESTMLERILDWYPEESFLKADGFDEAIIGVEVNGNRLIYSMSKCIEILSRDMSEEEAVEYFDFNVAGAYMGKQAPIFCQDDF